MKYNVKCAAFDACLSGLCTTARECGQRVDPADVYRFLVRVELTFIVNAWQQQRKRKKKKHAYDTQCENVNQIDRTEIAPKQKFRERTTAEKIKRIWKHCYLTRRTYISS